MPSVHMSRALELAAAVDHACAPNPMVGAVIVSGDRVVGEGACLLAGGAHAEVTALAAAGDGAAGATVYVTLEPCAHTGRTGPCVEALVTAGVGRVVAAMEDPDPRTAGRGFARLREAGIEVEVGDSEAEAEKLNRRWLAGVRARRSGVGLKFAMTLDGKIATSEGASKWITGEAARAEVHRLREVYPGVMVGAGTVVADDPRLDARDAAGAPVARQPVRVVVDGRLRTPATARVFGPGAPRPTIVVTSASARQRRGEELEAAGAQVQAFAGDDDIDLTAVLSWLYAEGVSDVLVEGGGELAWNLLAADLVDHVYAFVSPNMVGGRDAITPVEGAGRPDPNLPFGMRFISTRRLGADLLLEAVPVVP